MNLTATAKHLLKALRDGERVASISHEQHPKAIVPLFFHSNPTPNATPANIPMKSTVIKLFGALIAAALPAVSVQSAGTDTWAGNTDANWNTAANWTTSGGSTPPANGDSLVFGAAGSAGMVRRCSASAIGMSSLVSPRSTSAARWGDAEVNRAERVLDGHLVLVRPSEEAGEEAA